MEKAMMVPSGWNSVASCTAGLLAQAVQHRHQLCRSGVGELHEPCESAFE